MRRDAARVPITLEAPLVSANFMKRRRFIVSVNRDGRVLKAFLPHTGRLTKVLRKGSKLLLRLAVRGRRVLFDVFIGSQRAGVKLLCYDFRYAEGTVSLGVN